MGHVIVRCIGHDCRAVSSTAYKYYEQIVKAPGRERQGEDRTIYGSQHLAGPYQPAPTGPGRPGEGHKRQSRRGLSRGYRGDAAAFDVSAVPCYLRPGLSGLSGPGADLERYAGARGSSTCGGSKGVQRGGCSHNACRLFSYATTWPFLGAYHGSYRYRLRDAVLHGQLESTATPAPARPSVGPRWQKRRSALAGGRPAKSPRREAADPPAPWQRETSGRTPETLRRPVQTILADESDELIPAMETTAAPAPTSTWFGCWLLLAHFAVLNGGDVVGDIAKDPEQDAILPIPISGIEEASILSLAQQLWTAIQKVQRDQEEAMMPQICSALQQLLQQLRADASALPQVRQGLLLLAHLTMGNLLDPYSYAPATAQEWLMPVDLIERGGPFRGYLPQEASTAEEVQGLLRHPCPHLPPAEAQSAPEASP